MWNDTGWCTATKDVETQNDTGWRATAKDVEVWNDNGKRLLPFLCNESYKTKPHLGILLNNDKRQYVIPLTSAKEKHKDWEDVTAGWYRIYEVIDITQDHVREKDIIVEIKNQEIIKKLEKEKRKNYKQRILVVLDMRKMFPVDKRVYQKVKFEVNCKASKRDNQKMFLMIKEYNFLEAISNEIEKKTTKIYNKQLTKNKVLKYHCDYRKLEKALDEYKKE